MTPGTRSTRSCPPLVRDALRHALVRFERQIPGFAGPEGLLVGLESRSSGPVRIPRDRGYACARAASRTSSRSERAPATRVAS